MKQIHLTKEEEYVSPLTKEVQDIARRELKEDPKVRKKALADVRKWLKAQTHIKKVRLDSSFILRFLRMQKFEVKETCEILDKYLTMRDQHPEWFQNLDCRDPALKELMDKGYIFVLPERDANGRRVIFSQAAVFDTSRYTTSDMVRAHIMVFETLLNDEENQVRGFTYIFDEKSVGWSIVSQWTPSEISKAFSCCERAIPMRHREIHILNLPWTITLIFQFAKSLLSEKIRNRFQTHSGVESLHKAVNPDLLPKEYGGQRPVAECVSLWKVELEENRDRLRLLDQMKVAGFEGPPCEQLQLVRKKSRHNSGGESQIFGMVGNMRNLETQAEQ